VRSLTQEALAREMGVAFSTVNGWEKGRHRPIPALISKLLDNAKEAGLRVDRDTQGSRHAMRVHPRPER